MVSQRGWSVTLSNPFYFVGHYNRFPVHSKLGALNPSETYINKKIIEGNIAYKKNEQGGSNTSMLAVVPGTLKEAYKLPLGLPKHDSHVLLQLVMSA